MKTKPVVTHITERYAAQGETYIYEQAGLLKSHRSILLAENRICNGYAPFKPFDCFNKMRQNEILNRVQNFLCREVCESIYLKFLNSFYEKKIRESNASLIHAHFGTAGYKCLRAKQTLGLPLIITFYGVDISECVRNPYWIARYQTMFKHADLCIVLCDEALNRLVAIGCPKEKIVVWDIGIPLDEYSWREPMPTKTPRFLTVARFTQKKGHRYLIAAFRKISSDYPGATLTLLGNGPLKNEILRTISDQGLSSKITLIDTSGTKDFFGAFKEALNSHDIFVHPSVVASKGDDEGGPPVVITNAMAVGLPVISTRVGGIGRAVADGVNGLLSEAADTDSLAGKMRFLIEHPGLWEIFSINGRKIVEEKFSRDTQIAALEKIYRQVLSCQPV